LFSQLSHVLSIINKVVQDSREREGVEGKITVLIKEPVQTNMMLKKTIQGHLAGSVRRACDA